SLIASGSSRLLPELDAAQQTGDVLDDLDVGRQLEFDLLGVAATEVENAVVEDRRQLLDDLLHPAVPALLADLVEGGVAHPFLVALLLAERMMGHLDVGHVVTVDVEREAHA